MHDIDGLVLIYQNNNGELFEQYASDLPETKQLMAVFIYRHFLCYCVETFQRHITPDMSSCCMVLFCDGLGFDMAL